MAELKPRQGEEDEAVGSGPATATAVVADDFDGARHLLADGLRVFGGFDVVGTATNGHEAVSAVDAHRPDLALLDLAMPLAGGLDVIDDLNRISPATRVVVISGFPGRDLEDLVLGRGAAGYVRKQSSLRVVVEQIRVALGVLDLAREVLSATRRFGRDLSSAGAARRFLEETVQRWDCQPAMDTLRLLISEVVANAVVHADSEPEVSVRLLGSSMRIEVSDDSELIPMPGNAESLDVSGRGIDMVALLATSWGVVSRPGGGKSVWFEVPAFDTPLA